MIPIFKYRNLTEISCTSENLFKDLKTIIFKLNPFIRLDEFLKIHINFTLGSINILADKQTVQYKKSSSDEEINRKSINIIKQDENKVQPHLNLKI
jgi:hypothetical protein